MAYDNELRGVLFKNDKKESDKHPDYKGNAEVAGVEYWLAAWVNTSDKGDKFMSIKFEVKERQSRESGRSAGAEKKLTVDDIESDLPF